MMTVVLKSSHEEFTRVISAQNFFSVLNFCPGNKLGRDKTIDDINTLLTITDDEMGDVGGRT